MHTLPAGYAIFIDQNGWYFWANYEGEESKGSKDKWAEHHSAIKHSATNPPRQLGFNPTQGDVR